MKDASAAEVVTAIKAVAAGSMVMGARVAPRLHGSDAIAALAPPEREFPGLTTRERQVLGLVAEGQSNAQIADALPSVARPSPTTYQISAAQLPPRLVNTRRPSPPRTSPTGAEART